MKREKTVALEIKLSTLVSLILLQFLVLACVAGVAANTQVYNSLQRSRDALLDQRQYLQGEADRLTVRVNALQTQLDTVNGYLRDNDRALRDVETAMRQQR